MSGNLPYDLPDSKVFPLFKNLILRSNLQLKVMTDFDRPNVVYLLPVHERDLGKNLAQGVLVFNPDSINMIEVVSSV